MSGQALRVKHAPQRTCVACRHTGDKHGLVRLVRTLQGGVDVDVAGKKAGRGAYLCQTRACWETGVRKGRLDHALRTKISPEDRAKLLAFLETLPQGLRKEKSNG